MEGEDTLILCSYILLIRRIRLILFSCLITDKTTDSRGILKGDVGVMRD